MSDEPLLPAAATGTLAPAQEAAEPAAKKSAEEEKTKNAAEASSLCSNLFWWCTCLSGGEQKTNQDDFKYSESDFHSLGHSCQSEHGNKCCKVADELLGFALIAIFEVWKSLVVAHDLVMLLGGQAFTSMSAVKLANDIIEWGIVTGVCLMWMTFCYWSDGKYSVHSFWKYKFWPLPSLMPGGFMPRLAAFSLGILMFTTSTLVSEGRVEGKKLSEKFGTDKWELCRATDMEAQGASDMWFGRVLRRPPAVHEDGSDFTCFQTQLLYGRLQVKPLEFNSTDLADYSNALIGKFNSTDLGNQWALNTGVETPWNGSAALSRSHGFPMEDLVNWRLVDGSDLPLFSFNCMYQCSKWKSVGLMALIKNVGTIVAGSAVVVKTSDTISKNFGGFVFGEEKNRIIGLPLITEDTHPKLLQRVLEATRSRKGQSRSKLFAAIACVLCSAPLRFASKLDSNGYFTVDYYVTAVFFSSLLMACMVRQFNPYKLTRIAYTKNMWLLGEDSFICLKTHEYKKLNLYEWIHLSERARGNHLLNCARMLTTKDIDKELELQKDIRTNVVYVHSSWEDEKAKAKKEDEKAKAKKEDEKEDEKAKPQLSSKGRFAERAKKKDEKEDDQAKAKKTDELNKALKAAEVAETVAPLMQYHNEHATLTVKVLKEISFLATSPPIDTTQIEFQDSAFKEMKGVVQKLVVVRRNAVGTVIGKLDGERIMVRFPLEVPESVPLLESSQPHVGLITVTERMASQDPLVKPVEKFLITVDKQGAKGKTRTAPVLANKNMDPNKEKYAGYDDEYKPGAHRRSVKSNAPPAAESPGTSLDKWHAAEKFPWRQYSMCLTPSPCCKKDKKKLNAWLHNACFEQKKPEPHHMKDLEEQERSNQEKTEDQQDWEDVVVPLHQVMEVSKDWLGVEETRSTWYVSEKS